MGEKKEGRRKGVKRDTIKLFSSPQDILDVDGHDPRYFLKITIQLLKIFLGTGVLIRFLNFLNHWL